jgi:hypothetical protein
MALIIIKPSMVFTQSATFTFGSKTHVVDGAGGFDASSSRPRRRSPLQPNAQHWMNSSKISTIFRSPASSRATTSSPRLDLVSRLCHRKIWIYKPDLRSGSAMQHITTRDPFSSCSVPPTSPEYSPTLIVSPSATRGQSPSCGAHPATTQGAALSPTTTRTTSTTMTPTTKPHWQGPWRGSSSPLRQRVDLPTVPA